MSIAPTLAARHTDVCDEPRCREAFSHPNTCRCRCGGAFHAADRWKTGAIPSEAPAGAAGLAARVARAGDVFALMAAGDDEDGAF